MAIGRQGRLREMDGLRGWASLSVMLSHLLLGVFVKAEPPALTPFLKPFLEPLLGGTLDVAVFFVLSGDALSASYWGQRSRKAVIRLAVKRYFRLGIPILGSCLIVFAPVNPAFSSIARPRRFSTSTIGSGSSCKRTTDLQISSNTPPSASFAATPRRRRSIHFSARCRPNCSVASWCSAICSGSWHSPEIHRSAVEFRPSASALALFSPAFRSVSYAVTVAPVACLEDCSAGGWPRSSPT